MNKYSKIVLDYVEKWNKNDEDVKVAQSSENLKNGVFTKSEILEQLPVYPFPNDNKDKEKGYFECISNLIKVLSK